MELAVDELVDVDVTAETEKLGVAETGAVAGTAPETDSHFFNLLQTSALVKIRSKHY